MLRADHISLVRAGSPVLTDIHFSLAAGQLQVLLGANGAGKSSLLQVLAGAVPATAGQICLDEKRLSRWNPKALAARRALLPQQDPLSFPLTVRELMQLARIHLQRHRTQVEAEIAEECLQLAQALPLINRNYLQLSGGERARVQIARVLAQVWDCQHAVAYLLLDEPIAALDLAHQHLLLHRLRSLCHRRGWACLLVLHDLNLAARYADKITLMKAGEILASGQASEVLTSERLIACFGEHLQFQAVQHQGNLQFQVSLATNIA